MKNTTIIFDTETTDLIKAIDIDLVHQPHMTEIYCHKVIEKKSGKFKEIDTFYSLIKPPVEIPYFITKLTGIDDSTVKNAPIFKYVWRDIKSFFQDCKTVVGHNLMFDLMMVIIEVKRINKDFKYPIDQFCTVEQSLYLKGFRLKNNELYQLATGKVLVDSHRAEIDVLATFESYKWLLKQIKEANQKC